MTAGPSHEAAERLVESQREHQFARLELIGIVAATYHEDPAAIGLATVHWTVWLEGVLGVVLAVVLLVGSFS